MLKQNTQQCQTWRDELSNKYTQSSDIFATCMCMYAKHPVRINVCSLQDVLDMADGHRRTKDYNIGTRFRIIVLEICYQCYYSTTIPY